MKLRAIVVLAFIGIASLGTAVFVNASRKSGEERVITEALQQNNSADLIKALLTRLSSQQEKDDTRFPELIGEVEAFTAKTSDTATVALLHSMIAQMYKYYYDQNSRAINQRTDLAGYVPKSITEWTKNLFDSKIESELSASLTPTAILCQTPLSNYSILLEKDKDNVMANPTLFDFLARRAIEIQPAGRWYEALIESLKSQESSLPVLLASLDYLKFKYENSSIDADKYQASLDSLKAIYKDKPFGAEIGIAEYQLINSYRFNRSAYLSDSLQKRSYELCKTYIAAYPDFQGINYFKNILSEMEQPFIQIKGARNVYPGKELTMKISYKNTPTLAVRIYRSFSLQKKSRGEMVNEQTIKLPLLNTYTSADTVISIKMDKLGLYEYEITADDSKIKASDSFSVSRLGVITRSVKNGYEVLVADFESGKPLEGVNIISKVIAQKGNKTTSTQSQTNRFGLASVASTSPIEVKAILKDDSSSIATLLYPYGRGNNNQSDNAKISLFTDRGIYQPGQTISFKAIAYDDTPADPHVISNKTYNINLKDSYGNTLGSKELTTDQFGSIYGEFVLPAQCLNGDFSIEANNAYVSFKVENYVKPDFKIDFLPMKGQLVFGKQLTISGTAATYSGIEMQEGNINWEISQAPCWFRGYGFYGEIVAKGTTTLQRDGSFSIPFTPEPLNNRPESAYASYKVKATLTNSIGQTIDKSFTFSVGKTGVVLIAQPKKSLMQKDEAEVSVKAYTINQQSVEVEGLYKLYLLAEDKGKRDSEKAQNYTRKAEVSSGEFLSGDELGASLFKPLASGRYRLLVSSKDNYGTIVTDSTEFVLYSKDDKRPPVFSDIWFISQNTSCLPGENAEFVFGTSFKDAHILYELYNGNSVLMERKLIKLSNENAKMTIPFKEEYGNGCVASFTFVKSGNLYKKDVSIYRKYPDRKLTIKTETFRDKILPGSHENWTFKILNSDSSLIASQVLASMYDASLDALIPFSWSFDPVRQVYLQYPSFNEGTAFSQSFQFQTADYNYLTIPSYNYARLDWQKVLSFNQLFYSVPMYGAIMRAQTKSMGLRSDMGGMENMAQSEAQDNSSASTPQIESIRENFAETAFFYPTLQTNDKGVVEIKFVAPESTTTWKLQLLAQSKNLDYGYWSGEIVSSKPLMIQPNIPQFLRMGDNVTISAQIFNRTGKAVKGRANIELFNPENNQPVICLSKSQYPFDLENDSTTSVSWTFSVPVVENGLLGCRITADTETASDGEQHYIPILSNETLITESTPFYLYDISKQNISLNLPKNAKPFRINLEMTANPIWYAVQALPTLTKAESDNVVSNFGMYYSNILASHLVASNPELKAAIKSWSIGTKDASSLTSNLEKNQELKNILLNETPWVLDAQNETQQKQQLSLLFDENRTTSLRQQALQKLAAQQTAGGGWGWFNGMFPNPSLTTYVMKGMAQLTQLGAIEYNEQEKEMQIKALSYLDNEIAAQYEDSQKNKSKKEKSTVSGWIIDYLYMRSFYRDIPEAGTAREAIRFYTSQAWKQWSDLSINSQAEVCALMWRNGEKEKAIRIINKLRSLATISQDKGMYWANNRSWNNYFTSPLETHCLLISVFDEIAPNQKEIDLMKQWLLSQKRTQAWSTVPATVNAIYTLLLTGSNWMETNNVCTATWGDTTYSTNSKDGITGYLSVDLSIPNKDAAESLSVEKEGNAPAWGAVYTQYFQPIKDVKENISSLSINRLLFIEKTEGANNKKVLTPISEDSPIKIGDKVVVRLVINSNQEMSYVCLKDQRAACFIPVDQLSKTEFREGIFYYQEPTEASENFFIDRLPKGTFVVEYDMYAIRPGNYTGGLSTIQCLYAPEFVGHSSGTEVKVK